MCPAGQAMAQALALVQQRHGAPTLLQGSDPYSAPFGSSALKTQDLVRQALFCCKDTRYTHILAGFASTCGTVKVFFVYMCSVCRVLCAGCKLLWVWMHIAVVLCYGGVSFQGAHSWQLRTPQKLLLVMVETAVQLPQHIDCFADRHSAILIYG